MNLEDINPRLLRAGKFSFFAENSHEFTLIPRRCYNFEAEFFTSSSGGVIIDGEYFEFKTGDINFRKPGQVVCGVPPYGGYVVCFTLDDSVKTIGSYNFGTPDNSELLQDNELIKGAYPKIDAVDYTASKELFKEIGFLSSFEDELSKLKIKKLLYELLIMLITPSVPEEIYNRKAVQAAEYIREHYTEDIQVERLISKSKLSKSYFHKCFKAYTKTTPVGLITRLRLERAKSLLQLTGDSIGDIAAACGYLDNVYFSSIFKKYVGVTPREYRG